MVYTVKLAINAWRGLGTVSVENTEEQFACNRRMITRLFMGFARTNWLKLTKLEHNNEKKSYMVAINARRFGQCISNAHSKRIFEFI